MEFQLAVRLRSPVLLLICSPGCNPEISDGMVASRVFAVKPAAARRAIQFALDFDPYIPITSQFFPKVKVHEERHVEQFASIAPWKDLFDADVLYQNVLSGMTAKRRSTLVEQINGSIFNENFADSLYVLLNKDDMERDAFAESNQEPPHYLEVDIP